VNIFNSNGRWLTKQFDQLILSFFLQIYGYLSTTPLTFYLAGHNQPLSRQVGGNTYQVTSQQGERFQEE
jgi:hypothetical protein